jgi:hypothetical protein
MKTLTLILMCLFFLSFGCEHVQVVATEDYGSKLVEQEKFDMCDPPRGEGAYPEVRMRGQAFDTAQHHCI